LITHVTISDKDIEEINKSASKSYISNEQPLSYKGIVVPKPWGGEFLFFEDSHIAAWFLSIDKGHSTSMHCHPNKRTVLIILSGIALGRTLHGSSVLHPGKIVIYEPGVFHSTKGITQIEMAEIESPNKKDDLLRLEDQYGREKMGYEDKKTMSPIGEHFYLDDTNPVYAQQHYCISIGDKIKCGEINVIGNNQDGLVPNSCMLEDKDIVICNANILRFKFPSKENLYECRKCI